MAIEIKLATTVDEQLIRLKERGMSIDNEEFAREILMDIGYCSVLQTLNLFLTVFRQRHFIRRNRLSRYRPPAE